MRHVLVIDDDGPLADLMSVVLEEAGCRVTVANAETDIPSERFDCIVTDLIAVGPYSFAAADDWIRRLNRRFPRVPIIVATAHADVRDDAERIGAPVLLKPFDIDVLVAQVREVLA